MGLVPINHKHITQKGRVRNSSLDQCGPGKSLSNDLPDVLWTNGRKIGGFRKFL